MTENQKLRILEYMRKVLWINTHTAEQKAKALEMAMGIVRIARPQWAGL